MTTCYSLIQFSIDNTQSAYAQCMMVIDALENESVIPNPFAFQSQGNFTCTTIRMEDIFREWRNVLSQTESRVTGKAVQNIAELHEQVACCKDKRYLFRIRGGKNADVVNLQYLVLVLQKFCGPGAELEGKIGVFFPEVENYHRFSQYLRFIEVASDSLFGRFRPKGNRGRGVIAPLSKKSNYKQVAFFPLLEINEETFRALEAFAQIDDSEQDINLAYRLKEIADNMIKAEIERENKRREGKGSNKSANKSLLKKLQERESLSFISKIRRFKVIEYALFAATIDLSELDPLQMEKHLSKLRIYAMSLSEMAYGILQVIQNALHHSELKKGTFTFRLHAKERKALYRFGLDITNEERNLEVFISDFNQTKTMLDCFYENYIHSISLQKEEIEIKDLFISHDEADSTDRYKKAWKEFRQKHITNCQGLPILQNNLEKLNARLIVKSSTTYLCMNSRLRFSFPFRPACGEISTMDIPGTQFSILYNSKGMQSITAGEYSASMHHSQQPFGPPPDYSRFIATRSRLLANASAISTIATDIVTQTSSMSGQAKKNRCVELWCERFLTLSKLSEKDELYYIIVDFKSSTHSSSFELEVFAKGVIEYSLFSTTKKTPFPFAILDGSTELLDAFIHALKATFAVQRPPIQLYFRKKNIDTSDKNKEINITPTVTTAPKQDASEILSVPTARKDPRKPLTLFNYRDESMMFNTTTSTQCSDRITESENYQKMEITTNHKSAISDSDDIVFSGATWSEIAYGATARTFIKGCIPDNSIEMSLDQIPKKKAYDDFSDDVPFDVLLPAEEGDTSSIFDNYISTLADNQLNFTEQAGYRLLNIHMRLGSKVHLKDFYEMATLYQKPVIAQKVALQILRQMHLHELDGKKEFDLRSDQFLFYGYASYSRLIMSEIIAILNTYRKCDAPNPEFAIYQNDIPDINQESDTQVYFSIPPEPATKKRLPKELKIIQIVPISTTLTTFNKMAAKLYNEVACDNLKEHIRFNCTLFWVRDLPKGVYKDAPSDIEKEYWEGITSGKYIKTLERIIRPYPHFFIVKNVEWFSPLDCSRCYPAEPIHEQPLTETDVTSTVPTIQLQNTDTSSYQQSNAEKQDVNGEEYENQKRIVRLKDHLMYGHLVRGRNHFQYYIDTGRMFLEMRQEVIDWLKALRMKKQNDLSDIPSLHVIVTPVNQTNVEFFHYIQKFYFGGSANVITIDPTREYRSNFEAKFAEFKGLTRSHPTQRIKWHYIDDTIITGDTFLRANSLLHIFNSPNEKKTMIFDDIFVLINRLSEFSQRNFVHIPKENFHSFINLDISSLRTHGTSCTLCSMKRNAEKMSQNASVRETSLFWTYKSMKYTPIHFSKWERSLPDSESAQQQQREENIFRLLCAHIAKNALSGSNAGSLERILEILAVGIGNTDIKLKTHMVSPIWKKLSTNPKLAFESFIKVLSRPFFSFGHHNRANIFKILLGIAEFLFEKYCSTGKSNMSNPLANLFAKWDAGEGILSAEEKYVFKTLTDEIVKNYAGMDLLNFMGNVILESLADLKSNYLIRKETLERIPIFVQMILCPDRSSENCRRYKCDKESECAKRRVDAAQFYAEYAAKVQFLVNSSSDEARSFWLDRLFLTGNTPSSEKEVKFNQNRNLFSEMRKLSQRGIGARTLCAHHSILLMRFLSDIFINNVRVYQEGFKNLTRDGAEKQFFNNEMSQEHVEKKLQRIMENYYLEFFGETIKNYSKLFSIVTGKSIAPLNFLKAGIQMQLDLRNDEVTKKRDYHTAYKVLLVNLKNLIDVENISLCFESIIEKEDPYTSVMPNANRSDDPEISIRLKSAIDKKNEIGHIDKKGYWIGDNCIIIKLDNEYDAIQMKIDGKDRDFINPCIPILPVYIHIAFDEISNSNSVEIYDHSIWFLYKLEMVRRILLFKSSLVQLIERDFNNNAFPHLALKDLILGEINRSKIHDHASIKELQEMQRVLQWEWMDDSIAPIDIDRHALKVILLKSYVNRRIAHMYQALLNFKIASCLNENTTPDVSHLYEIFITNSYPENGEKRILKNLGDAFNVSTSYGNLYPVNYFRILSEYFIIHFLRDNDDVSVDFSTENGCKKLIDEFRYFDFIQIMDAGYTTENFFCIILDIMFNAVKEGFSWDRLRAAIPDNATPNPIEEQTMEKFILLKENKIKANIWIWREKNPVEGSPSYLCFKNIANLKNRDKSNINRRNQEIKHIVKLRSKRNGLSLSSIHWYIENLKYAGRDHHSNHNTTLGAINWNMDSIHQFELHPSQVASGENPENIESEVFFVQKLPVLKPLIGS